MLHPIIEEIWTIGPVPKLVDRIGPRTAEDSWESAYEKAKQLASRFELHDFVHGERYSYAWGRNGSSMVTHRFIVK